MHWYNQKITQCETCGNTDCLDCGSRNIAWQHPNICGNYLKAIIKTFDDGYQFVQNYSTKEDDHYTLLDNNRDICVSFVVRKGEISSIIKSDDYYVFNLVNTDLEDFVREEIPYKYRNYSFTSLFDILSLNYDINLYLLLCLAVDKNQYMSLLNKAIKEENIPLIYNVLLDITTTYSVDLDIIEKIERVLSIRDDGEYSYAFAVEFKGFNIEKLENIVIKGKNSVYIYMFAFSISGSNTKKLEDALIKTRDYYYIRQFAKHISGADIRKLEDSIISSNNSAEMYLFVLDVEEADTQKLKEAIIKTGDRDIIDALNAWLHNK